MYVHFNTELLPPFVVCMEIRKLWYEQTGYSHFTIMMSGPVLTTLFPTDVWDAEDLLSTPPPKMTARFNPT